MSEHFEFDEPLGPQCRNGCHDWVQGAVFQYWFHNESDRIRDHTGHYCSASQQVLLDGGVLLEVGPHPQFDPLVGQERLGKIMTFREFLALLEHETILERLLFPDGLPIEDRDGRISRLAEVRHQINVALGIEQEAPS